MAYGGLPDFDTYLSNQSQIDAITKGAAPAATSAPQATGTGNWLTAGLGAGYHEALAGAGGLGEALSRAAGYDAGADASSRFADSETAAAATYQRKDLEDQNWYSSPGAFGYNLAKMLPGTAVGIGGAVAGAALAPEEAVAAGLTGIGGVLARNAPLIGASLAAYPGVVGSNVDRAKEYYGELTQGKAAEALGLGVPEAALQGIIPGKLEGMMAGQVGAGFLKTVRNTAITQLPVGAATEYLTQQMGDPNRPFASRAQDIVNAALQGAVMGAATAGVVHPISAAMHALSKTPVQNVTNGGLFDFLNKAFNPVDPSRPTPQLPLDLGEAPQIEASNQNEPQPEMTRPASNIQPEFPLEYPTQPESANRNRPAGTMYPSDMGDPLAAAFPAVGGNNDNTAGLPGPTREPTTQGELALQPPGAAPVANPEPFRDPTPQPDAPVYQTQEALRKAGMAPVQVGKEIANAPANRNQEGPGPVRDATPALSFSFEKPGSAPIGNEPTLTGKVDKQAPIKDVITTSEGLRSAGLAPVDVGKETVNAPANRNVEGLGATRDATPQGDATKPADAIKPANDKFDQTPLQADLNKLPDLRKRDFKTTDEAQKAVADAIVSREAAGRAAPPALERVGKALGVIKDDGSIDPKFTGQGDQPEGPHETLQAGVQEPEAPAKADIPAQHQGRYDRLQELRDRLGDNLSDPETFGLVKKVRDLQNELQAVKGSSRTGQINGEIRDLTEEVQKRATPEPPATDPKALATSTAPSPATQAFIDARQPKPATGEAGARARKAGKAPEPALEPVKSLPENIPAVNPLEAAQDAEAQARMADDGGPAPREAPEPAPTQEAARKAARKAKASPEPAPAAEPAQPPQTQEAARKAARKPKAADRTQEADQRPNMANIPNDELRATYERLQDDPKARKFYGAEIFDRQQDGRMPKPGAEPAASPLPAKRAQARLDAVDNAEAMKRAKMESQTVQAVEMAAKAPVKTPVPPEIVGGINLAKLSLAELNNHKPDLTKGSMAARIAFNKNIAAHERQLAVIEKAIKDGGVEGLRNIRSDHFDDNLWSDALGRLSSAGEAALQTHSTHESYLIDEIEKLRGNRPLIRYETQPTVHDVDLNNVIGATNKLSDALEHIRTNDPSPMNRMMASVLDKLGLDTQIRMASDRSMLADTTRKLNEGELIAASYNDRAKLISIYDGSNVARSVLHEAFHAATIRALDAGSRAASAVRDLYGKLKDRATGAGFYGLENPEEMVAEAGSNPQFQQWLKSEPIAIRGAGDMWQAFKNAIFSTLGMPERVRTAFDQVMDGTQKLMAENPTRAAITGDRPLIVERGIKQMTKVVDMLGHEGTSRLAREAEGIPSGVTKGTRDFINGWTGGRDIAAMNKDMPTQSRYVESGIKTEDRSDTFFKTAAAAMHSMDGVSKKGEELINKVAARSFQGLDVAKKFEDHAHLKDHPKFDVLKEQHAQGVKDMDALRRIDGGKALKAFEAMRAEYALKFSGNNVHNLWDYVVNHQPDLVGKVKGFESDPFDQYERAYAAHDDPKVAQAWMQAKEAGLREGLKSVHSDLLQERDKLANQIDDDNREPKATKLPRDVRKTLDDQHAAAKAQFETLDSLLKEVDAGNERQKQAPYAHLGREGNHFVAASLAADDNGVVKEDAIDALGKMLQSEGFKDVAIMKGGVSNKFYARVGSQTERELLAQKLNDLKGHVIDGSIKRGLAEDEGIFNSLSSSRMRQVVEAAKANKPDYPAGATEDQKRSMDRAHNQNISELMRSMIELMPKSSMDRLYQRREGVQGFDANMVQNFRAATDSNSRGLANLTMARENGQTMRAMRDEMKSIQSNLNMPGERVTALQQAYNELMARHQGVTTYSTTAALDGFRKLGHIASVGLSPTYVMALGAQNATLTYPQLGSVHGFVRSAQAMAGVTNDMFKMVSTVARGQDASTFGVRYKDLVAAKINPDLVDFHMDMARRGVYNKGYSEAMTGHDASSTAGKAFHWANSLGRYAEMAPRVHAALAARRLYMEDQAKFEAQKAKNPNATPPRVLKDFATANDYAAHVVNESQLDWHAANSARQTTRAGMFGVMSPIINQFMGFQTRLTAKLYREVHGALGGDAQSQKFLLGHAAAVAVISGTLGLPMVAVAASVYDRLADWVTGKDDHDVIASYRTYLAHTFGKQVGEVIARGAPRAIGLDFDHAGEGKIAPGSTTLMMLTEKRKLEDAEKDWLKAEGGHAVGLMFQMAFAARDIMNGDYLEGSERMVPEILKGAGEAYRLGTRGFVDKNGQKLPITANAADIMMTAIGMDPAKEAEYNEETRVATGLNAMRQARSQNITRHLLLAQSRGDGTMFQNWEREATQFQLDHPGMSGPLQDFSRSLGNHIRATALARGFGTPLGVKRNDITGRSQTAFGNLRDQ